METRKKVVSLIRRQLAMLLLFALALLGSSLTAGAATTGSAVWTSQADFEGNAATTGVQTTRLNIDTSSAPGDLKIGASKEIATTATISVVAANKIYTTGVDTTTLSVLNAATKALQGTIALPARAAGVVYNSVNNKLYVGQYNDNKVLVIDCATDTVLKTLTLGNGTFASGYNSKDNKVYLANTADQTLSILDGASETVLATLPVPAGTANATFDPASDTIYLTNRANSFLTIVDGVSDQLLKNIPVTVLNLLGGQTPGSVGLRVNWDQQGAAPDKLKLSWNYDPLGPSDNIQLQLRGAQDPVTLDAASYQGPDGSAGTWYDASATGETTVQDGSTLTTSLDLDPPFAPWSEIQLKLSSDGMSSPVLHWVSLTYEFIIQASAGPGGTISPAGAVEVPYGADQSFTITPNQGYHIADVLVDGISQGPIGSYTFRGVSAPGHTISATFAINHYTLTYLAGANGTISGPTPQTVQYGGSGTQVTAVPNTGYHFVSWSDGVTNPSRTDGNVTADLTVTANFAINNYTLTYTAGPNGSISGPTPQTVQYGGTGATVTAVANTGYRFISWSDGVTSASRTDGPVTADLNVTANFAIITYTLNYTAGPNCSIIGATPQLVNYGSSGTTVTAVPNTGYHFVSWSDEVMSASRTDGPVTSSLSVAANCAINTYTLTYTAGPNGSISGTTPQTVQYGGTGTPVTAVANTGYHFVSWSDGVTSASRTDGPVTSSLSVTASFAINRYTLTYTAGPNGTISGTTPVSVNYGDSASFTITPNPGMLIAGLLVDGQPATVQSPYTFGNVTDNHTISVTFIPSTSATLTQAWSVQPPAGGYGGSPDLAGNYYAPEYQAGYVYRLNSADSVDWTSTTLTGGGSGGNSGGMANVVTDNSGNVYAMNGNGYLYQFTPSAGTGAVWSKKLPTPPPTPGYVSIMTVDNKGYLYLAFKLGSYPSYVYKLYKIRCSDGTIVWTGNTSFSNMEISGLVVDSQGKLYMTTWNTGTSVSVYKYDPSVGANAVATFSYPVSSFNNYAYLAIDGSDNIYLSASNQLDQLDTSGNVKWSVTPSYNYAGQMIASDGVNVYIGYDTYLGVLDAKTGGLKQSITNVPSGGYGASSFVTTDGYGSVYVHSVYNSSALGPITRYTLH